MCHATLKCSEPMNWIAKHTHPSAKITAEKKGIVASMTEVRDLL